MLLLVMGKPAVIFSKTFSCFSNVNINENKKAAVLAWRTARCHCKLENNYCTIMMAACICTGNLILCSSACSGGPTRKI